MTDQELWQLAIQGVTPLKSDNTVKLDNSILYYSQPREIIGTDLHGLTIQQAFNHTVQLCERAYQDRLDQFTIITGKSGQIRREFEGWLENPIIARYVKKYRPLLNGGSFIIYLKNQK
jgi:DNA-nicking Smr family endonuclease